MAIKDLKKNNIYNNLQKNKKNLIKLSVLFVVLSLTINAFAWLASHNTAEVETEVDVSSWIVKFTDENDNDVKNTVYSVDIQPGVQYEKVLTATNDGRTDADITIQITKFNILGRDIDIINHPEYLDLFPFIVDFDKDAIRLNSGKDTTFNTSVKWTYEEEKYYKNNDFYGGFHEDYEYYTYDGTNYNLVDVTAETYATLKSSLYLYKDDLDTYFGEACGEYQESTGNKCLTFGLKYIASQVEPTT